MPIHPAGSVRALALVGPTSSGKTTLMEALLQVTGSVDRRAGGDKVGDSSPEARARYIEEECAGDDELRRESLAAFDDDSHSFLTNAVKQAAHSIAHDAEWPRDADLNTIVPPDGQQSGSVSLE